MNPGDIILTGRKAQGIISLAIKLGQQIRGYKPEHRQFSHAALVVSDRGDIVEAQEKGVVRAHVSKYHPDDYVVLSTEIDGIDVPQVTRFADSVVEAHTKYGFVTFVGLVIYVLTKPFPWFPTLYLQKTGTAICSGFVSDALTRAGFIFPKPPFAMMPADLAEFFGYTE